MFLKISQISQENTRIGISFLTKLQASLQRRCLNNYRYKYKYKDNI